jgi:hypothetical protein
MMIEDYMYYLNIILLESFVHPCDPVVHWEHGSTKRTGNTRSFPLGMFVCYGNAGFFYHDCYVLISQYTIYLDNTNIALSCYNLISL